MHAAHESGSRRRTAWRIVAGAIQGLFYLAYPLVVYLAITRVSTRGLGAILLGLYGISLLFRIRGARTELWPLVRQHLALAALIVVAAAVDDPTLLLLLPLVVNLYLLWTFASSLFNGPPMIERFARLVEDDLPDFTGPYCRKVTIVWCVFLALNSGLIAVLAFSAPVEWWALYTGLIFYLLMGVIVGGEFVTRKIWFRNYESGFADRLFARAFPPEHSANGRRSLAYQEARRTREAETSRPSA